MNPLSVRSRAGRTRLAVVTVGVGLLLAAGVAVAADLPAGDTLALVGFALAGTLAAMAVIGLLARLGHGTSLVSRLLVVAAVSTAATAAGVGLSAQAMFISPHDLGVLGVVLVVSAALAGAGALVLSGRVAEEADQLARLAHRLGALGPLDRDGPADGPGSTAGDEQRVTDTAPSATDADGPDPSEDGPAIRSAELLAIADELHTAHDRLDRARRRALALDASRRELVAWVSHDLRSPIASIRAMAEALEDGVVDDEESVARYHRSIRTEAERLGTLVDDLFELSRISSGVAATAEVDLVPLDELLLDVVEGAAGPADGRGIALTHHLGDAAPLVPRDLHRVLRNLVDNAIAATDPGGRVSVEARLGPGGRGPQAVTLDVADECGGIDAASLPRLFEVGWRADAARRRDDGGGGLGLAIAKGLLEAHDGEISVVNDGPGCRFTVSLPLPVVSPPGQDDATRADTPEPATAGRPAP